MNLWISIITYLLLAPRVHTGITPKWHCENVARGKATYYGINDGFAGRTTANGETYVIHGLTAAHRKLPFNSQVRVTYGTKQVVVRINDRGPATWTGKDIDLSPAAFAKLEKLEKGVLNVALAVCKR